MSYGKQVLFAVGAAVLWSGGTFVHESLKLANAQIAGLDPQQIEIITINGSQTIMLTFYAAIFCLLVTLVFIGLEKRRDDAAKLQKERAGSLPTPAQNLSNAVTD